MSSHATEGTRPSAAPAGEPPTVQGASAAPAEQAPAGADANQADAGADQADAADAGADADQADVGADQADADADAEEANADAGTDKVNARLAPSSAAPPGFAVADYEPATMVFDPEPEPAYGAYGREPVSKLAILALITGLVALVPIAVAAGIGSLVGIRRTGRRGHGMAMAGLILSAAWVIVAVAVGSVGVVTHGFHKPVQVHYKEAAVFKLQEGDCVNSPNRQLVSVLPCSIPHEAEVFATFSLPAARWPGTSAIAAEASSGCASRLNGYVNPQLTISLAQSYVFPDQMAWTAGTRTVVCEVRASSGDLTGSVRETTLLARA
jgi:Septum formation